MASSSFKALFISERFKLIPPVSAQFKCHHLGRIVFVVRQVQPDIHQEIASIDFAGPGVPVQCVFIQAFKAKLRQAGQDMSADGAVEQHNLFPVSGDVFPCGILSLKWGTQAVQIAEMDGASDFFVLPDLLPDKLRFFIRQLAEIHFVAKLTGHGVMAACLERRCAMHLMVRHGGNVRTHRAGGHDETRAVLDVQALDGVRVIACPVQKAGLCTTFSLQPAPLSSKSTY